MDDLQVAWRPLDELIPYRRNPRSHDPAQLGQIAASIREFGWTNPVLVDGANGIIAGHGRVLAARKLGLERVPVIELAHMTEAQKRAYVLADNQLALNAGWDEALLRLELADLSELGFDLGLIGFGAALPPFAADPPAPSDQRHPIANERHREADHGEAGDHRRRRVGPKPGEPAADACVGVGKDLEGRKIGFESK